MASSEGSVLIVQVENTISSTSPAEAPDPDALVELLAVPLQAVRAMVTHTSNPMSFFIFIFSPLFFMILYRSHRKGAFQPFTAPTTTPRIKYFCTNGKMTKIGSMPMTASAMRTDELGNSTVIATPLVAAVLFSA